MRLNTPNSLRHCQQLLLNLLIVLCEHLDHLTVSSILMNNKTEGFDFGLVLSALPVLEHNFTEKPLDIPREKGEDGNCEEAGREDREESEERSHEGYSEEGEAESNICPFYDLYTTVVYQRKDDVSGTSDFCS